MALRASFTLVAALYILAVITQYQPMADIAPQSAAFF